MYEHKMNKNKFEDLERNYNYEMKQKKDRWGDYVRDCTGMTIDEERKAFKYFEEKRKTVKEHYEKYSQFDFSEESKNDLRQRQKDVFDKYFEVSGNFMKTIRLRKEI